MGARTQASGAQKRHLAPLGDHEAAGKLRTGSVLEEVGESRSDSVSLSPSNASGERGRSTRSRCGGGCGACAGAGLACVTCRRGRLMRGSRPTLHGTQPSPHAPGVPSQQQQLACDRQRLHTAGWQQLAANAACMSPKQGAQEHLRLRRLMEER